MTCVFVPRLFVEILNSCMDCDEIQFKEDGNWAPMRSKKEVQEVSSASYNNGLDGETGHKGWMGTGCVKKQGVCIYIEGSCEESGSNYIWIKEAW